MATPHAQIQKARLLYCERGQSLDDIAIEIGVAAVTVRRWRKSALDKGDDWDAARTAYTIAGAGEEDVTRRILARMFDQFNVSLTKLEQEAELSAVDHTDRMAKMLDAFVKATSAGKRVLPGTAKLGVAMAVLKHLADYISTNEPQHRAAFVGILGRFGRVLPGLLKGGK